MRNWLLSANPNHYWMQSEPGYRVIGKSPPAHRYNWTIISKSINRQVNVLITDIPRHFTFRIIMKKAESSINAGARGMKLFLKIAIVTLTLSPGPWKLNLLEILSYSTFVWRYIKIHQLMRALEWWQSFSKNSHSDLDLEPWKFHLLEILSYPTFVWSYFKIHQ